MRFNKTNRYRPPLALMPSVLYSDRDRLLQYKLKAPVPLGMVECEICRQAVEPEEIVFHFPRICRGCYDEAASVV